jgi:hypothetical protein
MTWIKHEQSDSIPKAFFLTDVTHFWLFQRILIHMYQFGDSANHLFRIQNVELADKLYNP